jgi:hypothetical protein
MGTNPTLSSPLSQQQKTVWPLIGEGLSAAAIATKLDVRDAKSMHPGKLAHLVFSELIPELKA